MSHTPSVYDATRPAEHHTLGPGRLAHAYPDNSDVALCGHTRTTMNPPSGTRCAVCEREAGRKNWTLR